MAGAAYAPTRGRWVCAVLAVLFLAGGLLIRRTMIGKVQRMWDWSEGADQADLTGSHRVYTRRRATTI
jgi:hypothetical protein